MSVLKGFAVISSAAIAIAASILLADYLPASSRLFWGYPALAYVAVAGAWFATLAWAIDRRMLAVPGHILSIFAPWGYLYPLPVLAAVLALIAGATFRTSRKPNLEPPTSSLHDSPDFRPPEVVTQRARTTRRYERP